MVLLASKCTYTRPKLSWNYYYLFAVHKFIFMLELIFAFIFRVRKQCIFCCNCFFHNGNSLLKISCQQQKHWEKEIWKSENVTITAGAALNTHHLCSHMTVKQPNTFRGMDDAVCSLRISLWFPRLNRQQHLQTPNQNRAGFAVQISGSICASGQ